MNVVRAVFLTLRFVCFWRYELGEAWYKKLGWCRYLLLLTPACFLLVFTSIAMAQSVPTERYLSFGEELDGVGDYVEVNVSFNVWRLRYRPGGSP